MIDKEIPVPDRAVLVGMVKKGESQKALDSSLDELEGLLKTAGGECVRSEEHTSELQSP